MRTYQMIDCPEEGDEIKKMVCTKRNNSRSCYEPKICPAEARPKNWQGADGEVEASSSLPGNDGAAHLPATIDDVAPPIPGVPVEVIALIERETAAFADLCAAALNRSAVAVTIVEKALGPPQAEGPSEPEAG